MSEHAFIELVLLPLSGLALAPALAAVFEPVHLSAMVQHRRGNGLRPACLSSPALVSANFFAKP